MAEFDKCHIDLIESFRAWMVEEGYESLKTATRTWIASYHTVIFLYTGIDKRGRESGWAERFTEWCRRGRIYA